MIILIDAAQFGTVCTALFLVAEVAVTARVKMTLDEFFAENDDSRVLFEALFSMIEGIGRIEIRISKSQIAFSRKRAFAWAWIPGKYLKGEQAPLVLSISLGRRDTSDRWKEVVEPTKGRFMHHLELRPSDEIDDEIHGLLREAWSEAGY